MAETLVLAELTIDSQGVVSGVAVAGGALDGLGRKTETVAKQAAATAGPFDLLTKRMFNLKTAAVALIGSFSLAGVLLGLKSLVAEIIAGDAAFASFKKSAAGVTAEFGALARETFNVSGGLQGVTSWLDRVQASMRALRQAEEEHPAAASGVRQGIIGAVLFGIPGVGGLVHGLEQVGTALDQLTKRQQFQIKQEREAFDPKRVDEWEAAVKKALAALPGPEGLTSDMSQSAFRLIDGEFIQKAERLPDIFNEIVQPLEEAAVFTDQTTAGWEATEDAMARIEESDLPDVFFEVSESAQLAASAIVAIGQSITQHIVQGGLTFKAVFADMLMAMVPVLLGLAAIHLLEWDFTGAALAFAAAIAAAAAAKALGAGATRDYTGGAAGPAMAAAAPTTNLQVNFAGPTFGFNESTFARYITDLQRRGERGGG